MTIELISSGGATFGHTCTIPPNVVNDADELRYGEALVHLKAKEFIPAQYILRYLANNTPPNKYRGPINTDLSEDGVAVLRAALPLKHNADIFKRYLLHGGVIPPEVYEHYVEARKARIFNAYEIWTFEPGTKQYSWHRFSMLIGFRGTNQLTALVAWAMRPDSVPSLPELAQALTVWIADVAADTPWTTSQKDVKLRQLYEAAKPAAERILKENKISTTVNPHDRVPKKRKAA